MTLERASNKSERLLQIEALLLAHPEGLSQAELARRVGVNRSTISRAMPELTARFSVYETDDGRLYIDRDHYLADVRFTLHEALSLHLAARLMATSTDKQNPHAAAALRKLGIALEKLAPLISEHLKDSADVMDDAARYHDPVYLDVLETLTRAWSLGRKVSLKHQLPDQSITEYTFAPYFVEPYAVGQSTHTIGWREPPGALRTFKVERIRAAKVLDTPYTIPPDFDARALLADAWGIWYTEKSPVTVRLRFHPRVAARVQETHWHRSAVTTLQPDGYLLWEAQIAEPREMLPWIRGWGGDVEVLEPEDTREMVMREVRRMGRVYGVEKSENVPPYFYLWAKANRDHPEQIHRLIYHLIDVGQVAQVFWQAALPTSLKIQLAAWLGLSVEDAGRLLAFWAALHDLGKASPAFQIKLPHILPELRQQGLQLPERIEKPTRHEVVSAWAIQVEKLLVEETGMDAAWSMRVAMTLSGHHGVWHSYQAITNMPDSEHGGAEWAAARRALVRELKTIFTPPACNPRLKITEMNAVLTIVSGFVSVVDWLGSDETLFRYCDEFMPLDKYVHKSEEQARKGLHEKGWLSALSAPAAFDFADLFKVEAPSPIQQQVIAIAGAVQWPALVIIESPTGSGKTEAALSLYSLWTQLVEKPGLYVAMPTTATSDQMHERVTSFLSARHVMDIHPLLVHSRALLREIDVQTGDDEKVEEDLAQRQTWFLPRKRSLLASFGVGTVDQAFLSVLQTRHFFVRLLGLSHKVVIFDEVHAYDAYMAEIFCRLLSWLRAVGSSVILLSATLPETLRRQFVEAYTGLEDDSVSAEYPRLTIVTADDVQVRSLPKSQAQPPLQLTQIDRDEATIIQEVRAALGQEACVAVICNTVRRAQEVYLALESANKVEQFCPANCLILFHARTKQVWRDETQDLVLKALSKQARANGSRPPRMVVVATQVIEQSLDLDFDVMLTDLAPLDLLVQRAGRLHRHPPRERRHPYRLLITAPGLKGATPHFPRTEFPYEPNFLYRTWAVLRDCESLTLTEDAPRLIEQVYDDKTLPCLTPALQAVMTQAQKEWEAERAAAEREAGKCLIEEPNCPTLLAKANLDLEEDNPDVNRALQALTRRAAPGISLICLHRVNGQVCLDPEGQQVVDVEHPKMAQIPQLARCAISVSSQPVVDHFEIQEPPQRWKKIAALRHARLAIFDNHQYTKSPKFSLRLTRPLGLQIDYSKSGGQDDEL